jgi:ABC-type ATPase involved in cell division
MGLWLEEDGETTRLDIARALVIEPGVFCHADPTINLYARL